MIERLHEAIAAVCPIDGVSASGRLVDVAYAATATLDQQAQAAAVIAAFDWSDEAHREWLDDKHPHRRDIRAAAAAAIVDNETFLALASPNNASVLAQVRRLTQQNNRIISRLVEL